MSSAKMRISVSTTDRCDAVALRRRANARVEPAVFGNLVGIVRCVQIRQTGRCIRGLGLGVRRIAQGGETGCAQRNENGCERDADGAR